MKIKKALDKYVLYDDAGYVLIISSNLNICRNEAYRRKGTKHHGSK